MKICVISDIHSNIFFFKKCLEEIKTLNVDKIFCLGDAVGYFDKPNEVMEEINSMKINCLLGNHEAMLLGYINYDSSLDCIYNIKKTLDILTKENLDTISQWLPFFELSDKNKKILFVHGSPYDPLRGYIYENEATSNLDKLGYDVVFMGHTHIPFVKKTEKSLLINVGSCGLPRDKGNMPSYVIFDTSTGNYDLIRKNVKLDGDYFHSVTVHENIKKCLLRGNEHG